MATKTWNLWRLLFIIAGLLGVLMGCVTPPPVSLTTPAIIPPPVTSPTAGGDTPQAPAASATAQPTSTPARTAALKELVNIVEAQATDQDAWAAAWEGQLIQVGGSVRTKANSRVTLSFSEGTIVRLAPNSQFILKAMNETVDQPSSQLHLLFGKLWVILAGGEMSVETPVGVAAVRGSLLSVQFNPDTNTTMITCLEGHCQLENGGQTVELVAGQAAEVTGVDNPPSEPQPMTEAEVEDWLANNPEATLVPLPTPLPTEAAPTLTLAAPTEQLPSATEAAPTPTLAAPTEPPPDETEESEEIGGDPICFDAETMEQIPCP